VPFVQLSIIPIPQGGGPVCMTVHQDSDHVFETTVTIRVRAVQFMEQPLESGGIGGQPGDERCIRL
jgi:hypothetical protein